MRKALFILLYFLTTVTNAVIASNITSPALLEEEAALAAQIQNYKQAIGLYTKSLRIEPNRYSSLLGRGNCYMELGNYDSARADFFKTLAIDTGNYNAYHMLGTVEHKAANYSMSISYYRKAIDINPNWDSYLGCWQSYIKQNKKTEGIAIIDSIITAKKSDPKISFNFAVLMLRQEKFKEAISQFIVGINMGGSSYQYHINKDYKYVDIKIHDTAFVNFVIKNGLATTTRDANYYLARIYSLLDNQSKAIELLTELHQKDPKDLIVYQDLGYAYLLDKKYKKAKQIFSECITQMQKNDNVYCNRGITHLETGELNEALHDFTFAIGLKSNNGWAYFYRGITNARMNNMKDAYSDFHAAKKLGGLLPSQENDIATILREDFAKRGW